MCVQANRVDLALYAHFNQTFWAKWNTTPGAPADKARLENLTSALEANCEAMLSAAGGGEDALLKAYEVQKHMHSSGCPAKCGLASLVDSQAYGMWLASKHPKAVPGDKDACPMSAEIVIRAQENEEEIEQAGVTLVP